MASIIKVGEKWRALIRRKGHPSYCKTFRVKAQAEAWARQVETDIDRGTSPAPATIVGRTLLMQDLIQTYRDLRDRSRPISDSSSEHYMLNRIGEGLGERDAMSLTPHDLVAYCQMRKNEGAGPYTCNMEISKLGTVVRFASVALKITAPDVVTSARPLLKHFGLIGGGGKRERRPTEDELVRVVDWMAKEKGQLFADIIHFAVATAMRRGEIGKLTWADVDEAKRLVLVRDRKDPRKKAGNDQWVPLLGQAWVILQQQVKVDDEPRIFPIGEQTVSKYFTEACRALSIPDLHFHDLRHEGTSRLFEEGFEIQQVALVTGHKDWRHLRRYTNLKPEDLHQGAAKKKVAKPRRQAAAGSAAQ
jgi:integrase